MTYKIKAVLCDLNETPLYWSWLGTGQQGDEVSFTVADKVNWQPIPVRPAGQITREEQEKLDPILGKAYREFGIGACDLIMAAFKLAKDCP